MRLRTHLKIDRSLSGEVVEISEGYAKLRLKTDHRMVADETGLIHGGFIFSLADFCAMATVNEPTVVLAQASMKFIKPVILGDEMEAEGRLIRSEGKKRWVQVEVKRKGEKVAEGEFLCVVPERHVLSQ
ncbi:MAG: PaaI family thioesterase [Aquificaceae bacterium]|nr:PaaI family thioesterase [Aquificaceae bacterium]MCS7277376.1 PaaI family thioesterase [Aquificaceae bacterium]MDW8067087.1 PaaI family thioesterase [Aquificaceae bacterium]MDW8423380.1 PaaI family thioesterase [Aquificaceae bacterium]